MHLKWWHGYLLIWLVWLSPSVIGQSLEIAASPPPAAEVYSRFIQLGRQHSHLTQSTALAQDHQGFLWIGTQHGLYRYDGQQLASYRADPNNAQTLSADWISSLTVDRRGFIWVGTRYGGLNLFDPATEKFTRFALPKHPGINQQVEISTVYQDRNLQIWVGTFGAGLFRWRSELQQLESVTLPVTATDIDIMYINALLMDEDGFLWLGTGNAPLRNRAQQQGGALRWHPERNEKQLFSVSNSELSAAGVTAIKADLTGEVWLSSYGGGLYRYRKNSQRLQKLADQPELLRKGLLTDLWFAPDGRLWVSSYDKGLWLLPAAGQPWQRFRANSAVSYQIQSNNLTGLWLDQQQTLWIKSPAGVFGLSMMAQRIRNIPVEPADPLLLGHHDVFGISPSGEGRFWVANRDAGIAEVDLLRGQVQRYPIRLEQSLQQRPTLVRQVWQDPMQRVWMGTDAGLFLLDKPTGIWQPFALKEGLQPHIGVLYQDQQQRLWVGTRGDGLYLVENGQQIRHFRFAVGAEQTLASDTISTLHSDAYGDVWIGYTDQGLSRLNPNTGIIDSWRQGSVNASGLRFNGIQLIYQEADHLWVRAGNVNHRVLRDEANPYLITGFKSYLSGEMADLPLRQASQFLWLYRTELQQQDLVQFGEPHGLQVTTWIGAWWVTPEGLILRGGNQGMDIYHPVDLTLNSNPLHVRLTGLSLFNKKVQAADPTQSVIERAIGYASEVRLEYHEDMFSLHFSALDLVQPASARFRYRLAGFDRDWIETDAGNQHATYTRLSPGTYQFEVMATKPGQGWPSAHVTRLSIVILPPWWLTWWAKMLAALAVMASIWGFLQYRLRSERQTRNLLEQVVSSRTAELQTQNHALAESYRDLMLLQMLSKQITASLDLKEILSLCHQRLNEIMDVHVLAIGVYDAVRDTLLFNQWMEDGRVMEPFELQVLPQRNLASVSFQQQREIIIERRADFLNFLAEIPPPINGEPMQSVLYFPLVVNGEKIGCLSLQSPLQHAFTPQQINLVRTLSSNIAIAVANANIVAHLQHTQQQLVMQEKMASLGGLVAGVAHEVNTPLGICVTAVSHLESEIEKLQQAHQQKQLQVTMFDRFLESASAAVRILSQNTHRAAALIQSFKQVVVDKSAIREREFELEGYLKEVLLSLQPELQRRQCQVEFNAEPEIFVYADAGTVAQILSHLVLNSLQHGFAQAQPANPLITIRLQKTANDVIWEYRDNGCGMNSSVLKQLFDPFFTTGRNAGHSGLGAHIVYNLVTGQLGGSIYVSSELGQGVFYRIMLPLQRRPD